MTLPNVLTIGHSTHSFEQFLGLLEDWGVTGVADVRSAPYSRFRPHFNRNRLQRALEDHAIAYEFLGRELGARSTDPACYENGCVVYRRLAATALFQAGLERVIQCARSNRLALLCAEKEPLECHRALLVARELEARGVPVAHIHADGRLEPHAAALTRLLELLEMSQAGLFETQQQRIEEACARQEARIAYVDPGRSR